MPDDDALPVDHVGHAVPAQIDAADHIAESVVFIDPHQIKGGFPVLLHRHSHGNAQTSLQGGGGRGGQIIRLLQKRKETALYILRRVSDPLEQLPFQIIQSNGIKFVSLGCLRQNILADRLNLLLCHRSQTHKIRLLHATVPCNGHHPIRQHMYIGLHGLSRLPGHGLQTVQKNTFRQVLQ